MNDPAPLWQSRQKDSSCLGGPPHTEPQQQEEHGVGLGEMAGVRLSHRQEVWKDHRDPCKLLTVLVRG